MSARLEALAAAFARDPEEGVSLLEEIQRERSETGPLPLFLAAAEMASDPRFGPRLHRALRTPGLLERMPHLAVWLAEMAYAPALEDLLARWRGPAGPARVWVAHALYTLGLKGVREAWEALSATVPTREGVERWVGTKALFVLDPAHAFDRLASLRPTEVAAGEEMDRLTAELLLRDASRGAERHGLGRGLFGADPRWQTWTLDLLERCAVRQHPYAPVVRHLARDLLVAALGEEAARAAVVQREGTPTVAAVSTTAATHDSSTFRPMMIETAKTLYALEGRLKASGYRFRSSRVRVTPTPRTVAKLGRMEKLVGPLPAAVRAFIEVVGAVDLSGSNPDWARGGEAAMRSIAQRAHDCWYTDPLMVASIDDLLLQAETWSEEEDAERAPALMVEPFFCALAPDDVQKAGDSGGAPIGFTMPCDDPDPVLENERGGRRFTEHVRNAIRWGGLPGFETIDDRPEAFLARVRRDA